MNGCDAIYWDETASLNQVNSQSEIKVLTLKNPLTYSTDRTGHKFGIDHDLLENFAHHYGLKIRFITVANEIEMKKADLKNGKTKFHFIEVKNVSLAENEVAMFPDSVTERGQKHLLELMQLIDWGHTCEILFTIQRTDGKTFSAAHMIDPEYSKLLEQAHKHGVKISPLLCDLSHKGIELTNKLIPLKFK